MNLNIVSDGGLVGILERNFAKVVVGGDVGQLLAEFRLEIGIGFGDRREVSQIIEISDEILAPFPRADNGLLAVVFWRELFRC